MFPTAVGLVLKHAFQGKAAHDRACCTELGTAKADLADIGHQPTSLMRLHSKPEPNQCFTLLFEKQPSQAGGSVSPVCLCL